MAPLNPKIEFGAIIVLIILFLAGYTWLVFIFEATPVSVFLGIAAGFLYGLWSSRQLRTLWTRIKEEKDAA